MGRRRSPRNWDFDRSPRHGIASVATVVALTLGATGAVPERAAAQSLAAVASGAAQPSGSKDKMLVEAKELIYNKDNDTVTASGNVQIYYQGKVLEADKVIYDRKSKRLYAEGNAKFTDADGSVTYGSRFDLTQDFRDGFIDSLNAQTKDNTRLTAPRAERTNGDMLLNEATYTACAPCAEHPEKPPLWQIHATKIIHNTKEQTIYYENATIELLGVPFAWVPFMSSPDSTVNSKSGILVPQYVYSSVLGYGVGVPIYWAMAPNYDLTVTPTYLSRQGLFTEALFRHRLMYGSYSIRVSGIFQNDTAAFPAPGNSSFRGSVESKGEFFLSSKWSIGWDAALWSDKYYSTNYKILSSTQQTPDYFPESISTAYLKGQGDRSYFDLRGYYIEGLASQDIQNQMPQAAPVLDYNRAFDLPTETTAGVGGQVTLDFNFTNINQGLASYQAVGTKTAQSLKTATSQYSYCAVYTPGSCLIRGIGGNYDRVSTEASWQRNIYDPFGGLWQPFAFAKIDGEYAALDRTGSDAVSFSTPAGTETTLTNANQTNWFGGSNDSQARIMPGAGVEYRFPLVASTSWATHIFEPIAQVIVRPNETVSNKTINEDSQSLVFDDTTLFEWNKFSGYDRTEGGTRLNAGAQYTMNFSTNSYVNAMAGQSFQLAGRNSYSIADDSNTGLDSGLEKTRSYYITRVQIVPTANYSLITKANFDNDSFALRRLDVIGSANLGHLTANVMYSRYDAQPDIGYYFKREGLSLGSRYNFAEHYFVSGNVGFDMSRHLLDQETGTKTSLFSPSSYGLGVGYNDDCTTFSVNYNFGYTYGAGVLTQSQSVVAQLTLRTLGTLRVNQDVAASNVSNTSSSN
jgi:LPS-assembly protein